MRKLINAITGTEMWVADDRLDEYLAAGHKPAASESEKPMTEVQPSEPDEPKKKPVRKTTSKAKK